MAAGMKRQELVARLVRAGELEVSGEDQAEVDTYFDTEESGSTDRTVSSPTTRGSPATSS
jgi:hypothetical protein